MRLRFLPDTPQGSYFVGVALEQLGWTTTQDDGAADLGFKWADLTQLRSPLRLRRLGLRVPVVNRRCSDIRKTRVARAFARTFGYPLALDPTRHRGPALRRLDENYTHQGKILECPIRRTRNRFCYTKLVDNSLHPDGRDRGNLFFDLRTPWFRGVGIPYVLVKFKRPEARFKIGGLARPESGPTYSLHSADEIYSADEQERIAALCQRMGLDVAELDVLRDRQDGRAYVVDTNWTPWGPTRTLSPQDRERVIGAWSEAFERCTREMLGARRRITSLLPAPSRPLPTSGKRDGNRPSR